MLKKTFKCKMYVKLLQHARVKNSNILFSLHYAFPLALYLGAKRAFPFRKRSLLIKIKYVVTA